MERLYLILNREGIPLAQAVLESPPGAEVVQMRLLQEDDDTDYIKVGEVQLIGLDNSMTSKRGVVTMQRGPRLVIRPGEVLGAQARENLRIQTDFESVMYPVSGFWKGQRPIQGHDLSCGGLAFYSESPALKAGEVVEVVLPVTDEPLLLHLRVLRELNSDREGLLLYASRFIDICLDEEVSIRKAVFSIQLNAPRSANDV